jgi:hypothetical protein
VSLSCSQSVILSIPVVPYHLHEPKDESLSANGWDNFLGTNYIVVTVTCLLGGLLGVLYALLTPRRLFVPLCYVQHGELRRGDVVFFRINAALKPCPNPPMKWRREMLSFSCVFQNKGCSKAMPKSSHAFVPLLDFRFQFVRRSLARPTSCPPYAFPKALPRPTF